MSIVAMSETIGSGGTEIGRALAGVLGWEFADREIITKTAEAFGEAVMDLRHATEERPTLWDRFRQSQRRYLTYTSKPPFSRWRPATTWCSSAGRRPSSSATPRTRCESA